MEIQFREKFTKKIAKSLIGSKTNYVWVDSGNKVAGYMIAGVEYWDNNNEETNFRAAFHCPFNGEAETPYWEFYGKLQ